MANCYWTGGTGTWDGGTLDAGRWKTATGGSTVIAAPGAVDTAFFDANSGGGTITVAANLNIASIQCGAFGGTLDFSVNNNSVNLTNSFAATGSGARTIKLGASIITTQLFQFGSIVNLVLFDAGTSVIRFFNSVGSGGMQSAAASSVVYNKLIIGPATQGIGAINFSGGVCKINTLEFDNTNLGAVMQISNNGTVAMQNSFNLKGSSRRPISLFAGSTPPATFTLGAGKTGLFEWASLGGITFSGGGEFIAKNCFDGGGNTGITFLYPQSSPIGGR